jgi:hypothetical protein
MPHDIAGSHEETEPDHGHSETSSGASGPVPMSEPLPDQGAATGAATTTAIPSAAAAALSGAVLQPAATTLHPICFIDLKEGCYRITYRPTVGISTFNGTMRVDKAGGKTTISGDLYRFLNIIFPSTTLPITATTAVVKPKVSTAAIATASLATPLSAISIFPRLQNIPIYPRNKYYSYLKVTKVQTSSIFAPAGQCKLTLTAQEYVYTQPPAGSFNGTFPPTPGTRTVTIVLSQVPPPFGFAGPYFEGRLFEGGVDKGSFSMGWVSSYFRRAKVEVDTLTGSVSPQPVPAISGGGTEDIRTVFATAGWDVTVKYDQTNVPVPGGVTATNCWSSADLHALMLNVRDPATNLDTEWHIHLVVVPAKLGCGRGVMYDTIGTPREGVASFSDDGYPHTDTTVATNFGTAADKKQRQVPRAFMRSASHELGHGFNQIHQEQEGGGDNSIMTTSPGVADFLGGSGTGAPGVFPDNINLGFNTHVRHHLVHFPDIVVRPGGMTFGTGHSSTVPEADKNRHFFSDDEMELRLALEHDQIHLGEPLQLSWELVNNSGAALPAPTDVRIEAQHTFISVVNPHGNSKPMASFVIETESANIAMLDPGKSLKADTRVFWSARSGFAFDTPGRYTIEARIVWGVSGAQVGVKASANVWVNYPQSEADNQAASTLLHHEVGMYVALGGGAKHLKEAVSRLESVSGKGKGKKDSGQAAPSAMRGYKGLI